MKYPVVLQHSEEDCGTACLATVAKSCGRTLAMNRVREAVGTGQLGTTLLGLRRRAEALGFNARSVKATPELIDRLNEAPLPAIVHWKGVHWVVLYGIKGKKYVVADPGAGLRYLTREALTESWNKGMMLLLVPDDNRFWAQPNDRAGGFGRFLRRVWHYRSLVAEVLPLNGENASRDRADIPTNADITCKNLNFHHIGRVDLLKDFSLTIPGGKVTALIGKSGCGKSTLAKLLAGLYPLQSGNIRFGQYNQSDLSLECLREQVVFVPQEAHFCSRSIIDNFGFCYPEATLAQIVTACQIACADEFVSELPDTYQTVLGEFGANLSGGQRQRLAIARALVTEPPC
jgi:ABC-type bacteriocin/lantibiotic exporter with double-glycine peptidase domain